MESNRNPAPAMKKCKGKAKAGPSITDLAGERLFAGDLYVDSANPLCNGSMEGFVDAVYTAGFLSSPYQINTAGKYLVPFTKGKVQAKETSGRFLEEYAPAIISGNLKLDTNGLKDQREYINPIANGLARKGYTPVVCALADGTHEIAFYRSAPFGGED
ncbi:MAG: hypothetical protein WC796_04725 [Candidatus Pacearchaeota archaeon]|jgi:hypothetical protein